MADPTIWGILPGFLTMDAMMWAANTTMLWHVYAKGMHGSEVREWLMVTSGLGGVAVLLTAGALWAGTQWSDQYAFAIAGIVASLLFALMVFIAVFRLVKRIPDQPPK